jgi:hypothetical protein
MRTTDTFMSFASRTHQVLLGKAKKIPMWLWQGEGNSYRVVSIKKDYFLQGKRL